MRCLTKSMILLISIFFILSSAVQAVWIPVDEMTESAPRTFVLTDDAVRTVLEVEVPGFDLTERDLEGTTYHELSMPEGITTREPGIAQMPYVLVKVALPDHLDVLIGEIEADYKPIKGSYLVLPAPEPSTDPDPGETFSPDLQFYGKDAWYPSEPVSLDKPAIWRDVRFLNVRVYPVRYNPARKALEAADTVKVTILYSGLTTSPKIRRNFRIAPQMLTQYEKTFINYHSWSSSLPPVREVDDGTKYLIIAKDSFAPFLQDFADWQTSRGLQADIVPLSEAGASETALKAFIADAYNTHGIEYVLLVGDVGDIWIPFDSGYPSDHWYACVDGTDLYADLGLGRISANTDAELTHQLNKILTYEQTPPDGFWIENVILCAHEEGAPGKYTGCKEEIREYGYQVQIPNFTPLYASEGSDAGDVSAAINAGLGIVNYRGHGSETAWSWRGGYDSADISALTNVGRWPVVFNICCYNGAIDRSSDCLAENWMKADGGSVGNLSATRASYTVENHTFDKRLFLSIFDDGIGIISMVYNIAKNEIIDYSSNGKDNARMYLWLGDPAQDVWTSMPITINPILPDSIPLHQDEVKIRIDGTPRFPVRGALVCLIKDPEIYVSDYTGADGMVILPISASTQGDITVNITAHSALPVSETFPVVSGGCGNLILNQGTYGGSAQVIVKVWDADLNLDPGALDYAAVGMATTTDPEGTPVVLVETGLDTGKFRGTVDLSTAGPGEGILHVSHGDSILANYPDASCEGVPQVRSDFAGVDALGPVISGVHESDIDYDDVTIDFDTDEQGTTVIEYGETPSLGSVAEDSALSTSHSLRITSLEELTLYYYLVRSADAFGNETVDDNGGQLYSFETEKDTFCFIGATGL